jgi:hypothetical protein
VRLTPRWSQRRLLLHFTVYGKFTLAVFRAVAQLWIVRPIHIIMKTFTVFLTDGNTIQILAKRYRKDGDQYVFERDEEGEEVQFLDASFVKGILQGAFASR